MNQKLANTDYDTYGYTYMKTRLQGHFGERIVQTKINGKPSIITFSTAARVVLQDYYSRAIAKGFGRFGRTALTKKGPLSCNERSTF